MEAIVSACNEVEATKKAQQVAWVRGEAEHTVSEPDWRRRRRDETKANGKVHMQKVLIREDWHQSIVFGWSSQIEQNRVQTAPLTLMSTHSLRIRSQARQYIRSFVCADEFEIALKTFERIKHSFPSRMKHCHASFRKLKGSCAGHEKREIAE